MFVGPQTNLRGCVIGKNTDIMRGARVEEGAVIGDECVIEEEAIVSAGVKVYPFKNVEAGAVVNADRHLGDPRRSAACSVRAACPGIVNVEITPELVGPARERVGDDAAEGDDRHDVA